MWAVALCCHPVAAALPHSQPSSAPAARNTLMGSALPVLVEFATLTFRWSLGEDLLGGPHAGMPHLSFVPEPLPFGQGVMLQSWQVAPHGPPSRKHLALLLAPSAAGWLAGWALPASPSSSASCCLGLGPRAWWAWWAWCSTAAHVGASPRERLVLSAPRLCLQPAHPELLRPVRLLPVLGGGGEAVAAPVYVSGANLQLLVLVPAPCPSLLSSMAGLAPRALDFCRTSCVCGAPTAPQTTLVTGFIVTTITHATRLYAFAHAHQLSARLAGPHPWRRPPCR